MSKKPENVNYPKRSAFIAKFGPFGVYTCKATVTDNPAPPRDPRFGPWGKQVCEDTGPLTKQRLETVDKEFLAKTLVDLEGSVSATVARDSSPNTHKWLNSNRTKALSGCERTTDFAKDKRNGSKIEYQASADRGTQRSGLTRFLAAGGTQAPAAGIQNPNIVFIMADDIGWMQQSIYYRGLMVRRPGHIEPDTIKNQMFASLAWLPTLVDIAGGPTGDGLKK